jgi:ArsR family transcriptional regulator
MSANRNNAEIVRPHLSDRFFRIERFDQMQRRDSTNIKFRAFADPTRLRILHLLHDNEWCVGDLTEIINVPQPTASRHLAYLRKAQLVVTRKEGLWIYYSLAPARNDFHQKLLECLDKCFAGRPELKTDQERAERLLKTGGSPG